MAYVFSGATNERLERVAKKMNVPPIDVLAAGLVLVERRLDEKARRLSGPAASGLRGGMMQ